nr:ABC transporter substrate-binding protein [Hahella ganghwensis]
MCSSISKADTIQVVTTDFPPYSYERNGKVHGMATEIVKKALTRAGLSYNLKVFTWSRAYHMARNTPNTLIFSIARSKERENEFHWVGKVAPYSIRMYKLAIREDIKVDSLEDAKQYIVGGEHSDIKQAYLLTKGFETGKNILLVNKDELNIRKLFAGRIDLLPFNELSLPIMLHKEGHRASELEPVLDLGDISHDLYAAFHKDTSQTTVNKLKREMDKLKQSGWITKIQDRHLDQRTALTPSPAKPSTD